MTAKSMSLNDTVRSAQFVSLCHNGTHNRIETDASFEPLRVLSLQSS
jgi:hypothetical protein